MRVLTRRNTLLAAAAAALASPARATPGQITGQTPGKYGRAPEFSGIAQWLNSAPLTMASLRGRVVLVDFWAYSCINCLRTLPYLTKWYDTYKDRGLVIVGVHTPEFPFEKRTANVQMAIDRFGIHYPVAQDNDSATWNAFSNQFWPAEYLIDREGRIVLEHSGEGQYDETENAIRKLLAAGPAVPKDNGTDLSRIGSPEMYFGLDRIENLASPEKPRAGTAIYTAPATLPLNRFALAGTWNLSADIARLAKDGGAIRLHFRSAKLFMVASSPKPVTLGITVDGKAQAAVAVNESRLYTLFESADYTDHVLDLSVPKAGFEAFTFTFG